LFKVLILTKLFEKLIGSYPPYTCWWRGQSPAPGNREWFLGHFFASGSDWLQRSSHPASRNHWRVNFREFLGIHPHPPGGSEWSLPVHCRPPLAGVGGYYLSLLKLSQLVIDTLSFLNCIVLQEINQLFLIV